MGTGNLTDQNDGEVADAADVNQIISATKTDIVPRNASGFPTANAGSIGTTAYPFKSANITTGSFFTGMIMPMIDYNGAISPGQGWFPCSGAIINSTNYDAIHGAGSWTTYIGSSDLDGLYAPNINNNKYIVGSTTTTDDGTTAITTTGNTSHSSPVSAHTHSITSHVHAWAAGNSQTDDMLYYDVSGNETPFGTSPGTKSNTYYALNSEQSGGTTQFENATLYTSSNGGGNTGSDGSHNVNVQPESYKVQYFIRIV